MRIGIIGVGSMGRFFARSLARLGHHVAIASARGPAALAPMATELGVRGASIVDAVRDSDIVILAIPTKAVPDLPPRLFTSLADDVIVIDVGNYHPELRDGRIEAIDRGMLDSEWVAQRIGRPVIKAFNNILATSLVDKRAPRGARGRVALPVAGDSLTGRAAVLRLVDDLGFEPVDAGELECSWRQQTGTPAYCKDLGAIPLLQALGAAEQSRIAEYRAAREAELRRSMAASAAS